MLNGIIQAKNKVLGDFCLVSVLLLMLRVCDVTKGGLKVNAEAGRKISIFLKTFFENVC